MDYRNLSEKFLPVEQFWRCLTTAVAALLEDIGQANGGVRVPSDKLFRVTSGFSHSASVGGALRPRRVLLKSSMKSRSKEHRFFEFFVRWTILLETLYVRKNLKK
jgi:hypothetical protein